MKSILNDMRLNICNVINSYDLPIDIKYYIVKDVFNEVTNVYNNFLMAEEEEPIKEIKEENKNNIKQEIKTDKNGENPVMEITANVEGLDEFLDKEKILKAMEEEGTNEKSFKIDLKENKNKE